MPIDNDAPTIITGFDDVPAFAHGMVRDIRLRWACEEIGRPYRAELFAAMGDRPDRYRDWQPFDQVPAFEDGDVRMFESGAILLYLGEQDERLLPREPKARWDAIAWLIAALNSVEPALMNVVWLDIFNAEMDWARDGMPAAVDFARQRPTSLSDGLTNKDWLTGRFNHRRHHDGYSAAQHQAH